MFTHKLNVDRRECDLKRKPANKIYIVGYIMTSYSLAYCIIYTIWGPNAKLLIGSLEGGGLHHSATGTYIVGL